MSDTLLSRFLRYVQVDTQSDETSKTFPSTSGQLVLLEMLKHELIELGAADVQMTRHGYVLASIPANTRKARVPTVAFLAHVDTAPDCSGKNVKPIVHRKYDGRIMTFPDKPGLTLDPATSPELRTAIGKDIVTASGTTLLGSDDKSGVAVIVTLVERLLRETKRKHGLIRVCFTPDEEIGRGVNKLDLRMLGADVAYTLDGGPPGDIFWRCGRSHHRWHHHSYDGSKGQRDGERGLSGRQTSGSATARTLRAGDNRRAGRIHSPHPRRRPDRADRREISPARLRAQGAGGQGQNIAWPLPGITSQRTAGARPLQDPQTISQHGLLVAQGHAPG